jgi:two-component system phosphate regulon response regulator PhoB
VRYHVEKAGMRFLHAADGGTALRLARAELPDVTLLDLTLRGLDGLEVCRQLRRDPATRRLPIIMLTARGEEVDRVVGLELGADDYVVKPFSVRELVLRISAVLRRSQGQTTTGEAAAVFSFGRLRVDRGAHRVWVDGEEVALTALEMRLLWTLYERRGRVQSRGTLLDEVWDASPENNTRTVDTHVKRLREKLGAAGAYVETVRGVGYRFSDHG